MLYLSAQEQVFLSLWVSLVRMQMVYSQPMSTLQDQTL